MTIRPALAALLALAPATLAGDPPPKIEFGIGIGIGLRAIKFSPDATNIYAAYISPGVSGFSEFGHPGNFTIIQSPTGDFTGTEDSQQNTSADSTLFATLGELKGALAAGLWTVSITDGLTAQTYVFNFSIDPSALTADYLRPITFTGVQPNTFISPNPTFTWTQPSTSNPDALPNQAFNQLYSDDFANIYTTPNIDLNSTSWTPDTTLVNNRYSLFIGKYNSFPNQNIVTASLDPVFPPGATAYLIPYINTGSASYVFGLRVGCPGDLNNDNAVSTPDLTIFLGQFGQSVIPGTGADFTNDGLVSTPDLAFFLGRFGQPCP